MDLNILANFIVLDMDSISLMLIVAFVAAIVFCGLFTFNKQKNRSTRRNSNKACQTLLSKSLNCKKESVDHHNAMSTSSGKHRKSRSVHKRQDVTNHKKSIRDLNNPEINRSSSEMAIKNWLQKDMNCYDRSFISSCAEDKMLSCHNKTHRNSTSSEVAGSDDLNYSSSNEDMCLMYLRQTNPSKKGTKSKHKKHKLHPASSNKKTVEEMDISDEASKENVKPNGAKITSASNLRKQCTQAAAFKAALNNSKPSKSKSSTNGLIISESKSSYHCSISPASSTTSIHSSLSSSASSSPAHSVNSSPTASPTASKRNTEHLKKSAFKSSVPPLRQFSKLDMNEHELVQQMKRYVMDPSLLRVYGFPVESVHFESCVEIYKCLPKHLAEEAVTKDNQRHHRHFYGRKTYDIVNKLDDIYSSSRSQQWYGYSSVDSGHDSADSSPRFTDSDSSEMGEEDSIAPIMAFYTPDGVYQIFSEYSNSIDKQCVRCSKIFQVNEEGQYLSFDSCTYHWGKLSNVYNGKCYINIYSCCQGEEFSEGCSQHNLHVWNGVVVGINGPYPDFVHTQHKEYKQHKCPKVYAMDCEMSYTGLGLEVTKVTVVAYDGSLVYEHFVRPQAKIIDYNTRFSGVSEKDFMTGSQKVIKTFAEVQNDLLELFDADTILIGHALDNDLRVLRLVHKTIVDTSVIFNHSTGYPYKRSLKNLTKSFLKRDIQCSDVGHSSFEDSRACLELMMWKVRKDLRHWVYQ